MDAKYNFKIVEEKWQRRWADEKLFVTSPDEARKKLGIGRALMYEALRHGIISNIRIGRRILIPNAALERLLENQGYERRTPR